MRSVNSLTPDALGRVIVWSVHEERFKAMPAVDASEALARGSIALTDPQGRTARPHYTDGNKSNPHPRDVNAWTFDVVEPEAAE